MTQRILVTGATGTQGGAVIQALFDLHDPFLSVIGLTRDPVSTPARNLIARYPELRLIAGDYTNPAAIFFACEGRIDKIFLVQTPPGFPPNADLEQKQGKALIDAAIEHGVNVFVQTTVDRGPESDTNSTDVPHFASKFRIEKHIIQRAQEVGEVKMSFTILRPTVFMDNFSKEDFMAKILATSLRDGLPSTTKIQMIASSDIGFFAAQALTCSSSSTYRNKAISLAGDELSYEELQRTYEEVCQRPLPTTYSVVSWGLGLLIEGLAKTLKSFEVDGFSADVEALTKLHPGLKTWRAWLVEREGLGRG